MQTTSPETTEMIEVARAAVDSASASAAGEYLGSVAEDDVATRLSFAATEPGYVGWQWSVVLAQVALEPLTVSEVLLLPGPDALVAPTWVPWDQRVQPGDLGVGDLLPPPVDDPRLVPGYADSDDPQVMATAAELGLGRPQVMSRDGRIDAAERWHEGDFSPSAAMARSAPANCGTCGFFLPLAGWLGGQFGACGNEFAPADGRVVDLGFGCGAHSEVRVDLSAPTTDIVIDEVTLDVHPR